MNTDKFYQIALTLVPNVGDVAAKKLLAYCGSVENVFKRISKKFNEYPRGRFSYCKFDFFTEAFRSCGIRTVFYRKKIG